MFHNLVRFVLQDAASRIATSAYHILTAADSPTGSEITAVQTALQAVTAAAVIGRSIDDYTPIVSDDPTETGLSIRDRARIEMEGDDGSKFRCEIPQPKLALFEDDERVKRDNAAYLALIVRLTTGGVRTSTGGVPTNVVSAKRSRRRRKAS